MHVLQCLVHLHRLSRMGWILLQSTLRTLQRCVSRGGKWRDNPQGVADSVLVASEHGVLPLGDTRRHHRQVQSASSDVSCLPAIKEDDS